MGVMRRLVELLAYSLFFQQSFGRFCHQQIAHRLADKRSDQSKIKDGEVQLPVCSPPPESGEGIK
jgi:hypothetical protein